MVRLAMSPGARPTERALSDLTVSGALVRPRVGSGRLLPCLIALSGLLLTGLIARDHVLRVLRPAEVQAEQRVPQAARPVAATSASRGPAAAAERRSPVLTGQAAERALAQQRREDALGKMQEARSPDGAVPVL